MPQFRILHISDLHIGRRRLGDPSTLLPVYQPHDANVAEALARFCYDQQRHFDVLVITGDLSHSGNDEDLSRARRIVFGPRGTPLPWLNGRWPTLRGPEKPIVLLPGNHDRYQGSVTRGKPGGVKFDAHFDPPWTAGLGGVLVTPLPDNRDPVVVFIAADFCLASAADCDQQPFARHGQGRVYSERLEQLAEASTRVQQTHPKCAVVWLVHFAPEFEDVPDYAKTFDRRLRLIDGGDLVTRAGQCDIHQILCGHTHRACVYPAPSNGQIRIYCAGSACCMGQDTTIHLLDVSVESGRIRGVRKLDLRWQPKQDEFVPERPKP